MAVLNIECIFDKLARELPLQDKKAATFVQLYRQLNKRLRLLTGIMADAISPVRDDKHKQETLNLEAPT